MDISTLASREPGASFDPLTDRIEHGRVASVLPDAANAERESPTGAWNPEKYVTEQTGGVRITNTGREIGADILPGHPLTPEQGAWIKNAAGGDGIESVVVDSPSGGQMFQMPGQTQELHDFLDANTTARSQGGLLDQLGQEIDKANAAGDAARAARIARARELMAPLYGDRTSTMSVGGQGVVPGFEDPLRGKGDIGRMGAPISDVPHPSYTVEGGTQSSLPQGAGNNLGDTLQQLYANARATSAAKLPAGVTPDMVTAAHTYIDTLPGAAAGTPHADLNNLLRTGASPADIERFMSGLEGRSVSLGDVLHQARTGSMAGGLTTEGKVALGPLIQTAMRAPTAALHLALTGRASEIPRGLTGGLDGLAEGAQEAMQTLRYGTNYRAALTRGASGGYGFKPGLDVIGKNPLQRAIGTALGGLVRTHGAIGDISAGIGRGANAALGATPEAATEAGQQWAFRSGEYGATGKAISNALGALSRANPALNIMSQIVIPFYKVGYNVFTQGVEHSPVGLAGRITDAVQGKALDSRKLTNNLFGVGLAAAAFKEAADGNITGQNPTGGNPKQSMRIAGQWVPLRTIGPASEPLAQAAALYESARDNTGDTKGMAAQLASEYIGHVYDETWLSSMGDFFDTVGAAKDYSDPALHSQAQRELGYQATQYGKSLIPQEKLGEQGLGLINKVRSSTATPAAPTTGRPATVRTAPATTGPSSDTGRPSTVAHR